MRNRKIILAALAALVAIAAFAGITMAQNVTAAITSPTNGATVSGKVTVQGTASGPTFGYYKVEFKSTADWVLVDGTAKHTPAVMNGNLATWDTATVPDGSYDLRLLVADVTGQYVTTQVSVKVANAAAQAAAEAPRRGCEACHTQIAPDGRYSLAWEAQNASKAAGKTHPALPNGFKTTEGQCLACHASNGAGDAGVAAPLSLRAIVHPVHEFSDIFLSEFKGNCFSCHNVDGTGKFAVIGGKMNVDDSGIPTGK